MELLQNPSIGNCGREILAEEIKEGTEGAGHGQNVRHVLLLLASKEKVLRLVREPEIGNRGIIGTGEDRLPDIGEHEPLKEETHPAGDHGAGAVDEYDFPLVLQAAK